MTRPHPAQRSDRPSPGSAACKIHVSGLARLYEESGRVKCSILKGTSPAREGNIAEFTILDIDGNALVFFEVESAP